MSLANIDRVPQGPDARDGLVVSNRGTPRGGVDDGTANTGQLGQLLLDTEMIELLEEAADLEGCRPHCLFSSVLSREASSDVRMRESVSRRRPNCIEGPGNRTNDLLAERNPEVPWHPYEPAREAVRDIWK
jgi:hypothetical protein